MADVRNPAPDSPLTVRLEAQNREVKGITQWSIESDYMVSADGFSFTAVRADVDELRDLELQPVELLVNGASQVLGRIEVSDVGGEGLAYTFLGRDYLADLVECNVDPLVKIKDGDTIAAAFIQSFSPVGIDAVVSEEDVAMRDVRTGVSVKVGKGGRGYAKRVLAEYKPKPGEGMYEFGNRLVARFGATIQPGPDRSTVVISTPDYQQSPVFDVFRSTDPVLSAQNNVITSRARRDFSKFPTYALFAGWQAPTDEAGASSSQVYDLNDVAFLENTELARILADSTVQGRRKPGVDTALGLSQLYRLLYFRDKESRTQDQLSFAALRAIAERLKDTLEYQCTVRGHVYPPSGAVWSVNTMCRVSDFVTNVQEPLWIKSRTLRYSPKDGATTDLVMYRPSSFFFGTLDGAR